MQIDYGSIIPKSSYVKNSKKIILSKILGINLKR